jgi:hypothetical protein
LIVIWILGKGWRNMTSAKKICIVCEKNISNTRGKEIRRCQQCNNTVCNEHFNNCRICNQLICNNELRKCDYCPFDQCKNCTNKYRKNHEHSYSFCCTECFRVGMKKTWINHRLWLSVVCSSSDAIVYICWVPLYGMQINIAIYFIFII